MSIDELTAAIMAANPNTDPVKITSIGQLPCNSQEALWANVIIKTLPYQQFYAPEEQKPITTPLYNNNHITTTCNTSLSPPNTAASGTPRPPKAPTSPPKPSPA